MEGRDDPHLYASLLKEFFRMQPEPLIPDLFYDMCLYLSGDKVYLL